MVGMNAVVMDNAVIGPESIVAAMAFVKADMQVPARVLVAGVPGRVVRALTQQEIDWKTMGTRVYQGLTLRSQKSMRSVEPLREAEPDRGRLGPVADMEPLFKLKRAAESA